MNPFLEGYPIMGAASINLLKTVFARVRPGAGLYAACRREFTCRCVGFYASAQCARSMHIAFEPSPGTPIPIQFHPDRDHGQAPQRQH